MTLSESRPNRRAYLDYNATSPLRREALDAIRPLLVEGLDTHFGNPSSIHWAGQAARRVLEDARGTVAGFFGRKASEIIFTSGATEANNLALTGVTHHPRDANRRLVVSAVEHPSVLAVADRLAGLGVDVVRVPVDHNGAIALDVLEQALKTPTTLVSVAHVNNETGIISPIDAVIRLAHEHGALVHVDAVQSVGRIVPPLAADLISISAHKLGGLKGAGALIARSDIPLLAQNLGGPQERTHRAGTENVVGAVSLAAALTASERARESERERLTPLRDRLEATLVAQAQSPGDVEIIGAGAPRVFNTCTLVFKHIEGDTLLQALDLEGVAASSGSACSSGSLEPSHVLLAMQVPASQALGAIRFSLGWATSSEDIEHLLDVFPRVYARAKRAPGTRT
ncbi:MAG: cysteine desulfurase [Deltaproteobacteria bacterium]|nr:cysteine desulfurase [Deltaproteobacteria bacterium]